MNHHVAGLGVLFSIIVLSWGSLGQESTSRPDDQSGASLGRSDQTITRRGGDPKLSVSLASKEECARKKTARVVVTVKGLDIVDPEQVGEQPKDGQGHLHYRLDVGPIIATTSPTLSFHELSSGEHKITVMLAGNDHRALGSQQTLSVNIP